MLSRLPKPVEISHECIKTNIKYQVTEFYYRLFDKSENGPFSVPPGRAKTNDKNN